MSRKTPAIHFDGQTKLSETGLEFIDVVLTERFLLPPDALRKIGEPVPETLGEVAAMSGLKVPEVIAVVEESLELSRDLYIDIEDLQLAATEPNTVIVDMRPNVSFETEPLHPDAKMFHMQKPAQMLPFLRSMSRVIVLSEPQSHAWSAALSLRKMNIKAILCGPL